MNSVDATLLHSERAHEAPEYAKLAEPDGEPIVGPTRTMTIWVGSRWAELRMNPFTKRIQVLNRGKA